MFADSDVVASIAIVPTQLNGHIYCYITLIMLFKINYLFADSEIINKYCFAQSAWAVEYTDCKTPKSPSDMDMTLNNLMVTFQ